MQRNDNKYLAPQIMTSEQRELFRALTIFQKRLATALLSGVRDLEAYRTAQPGGKGSDQSARVIVTRTRAHPKVKAYLDAMEESFVSDAIMTKQEAMLKLSVLGRGSFASMCDFQTVSIALDEDGNDVLQSVWKIKDAALLDPAQLACISELSATGQGLKMKIHSPVQAIQQLAAMAGWQKATKVDHLSSDGSMTPKAAPLLDVKKLSNDTVAEILDAYDSSSSDT